jgi:hypothetical protein
LKAGEGAVTIPEFIINWVECITGDMAGVVKILEEQVDSVVELSDTMDVAAVRQKQI